MNAKKKEKRSHKCVWFVLQDNDDYQLFIENGSQRSTNSAKMVCSISFAREFVSIRNPKLLLLSIVSDAQTTPIQCASRSRSYAYYLL